MCGVFAMFLNRPLRAEDVRLGRAATAMLAHRGPDGDGEWRDDQAGVYLGHRRLAIIDPTNASRQPMTRGGLALTYNGELYNYRELAAQLSQEGARFATTGDAEVLLAAWARWGADALDRFDGMYAFALWDGLAAHLVVDPFGEKPLFVAERPEGVYVSSELRPLAALLGLAPSLTPEQWTAYFAFGNLHAPETPYPGVRRLPPASLLTIEGGRCGPLRRYWSPPFGEPGRGPVEPASERALDEIAAALADSLRGRLIADAPLTLFLSGGVDSSLVAALAARELKAELTCLTVAFPRGDAVNEAPRAARIAAHLGLPHRVLESNEDPSDAGVDALVEIMQQPHDNLSALSVRQLSAVAAREFKVALTGMGGDELTFGYGKHTQLYANRRRYGLPEWLRRAGGCALALADGLSPRLERFRAAYLVRDHERYIALKDYPAIDWLRRQRGFDAWARREFGGFRGPLHIAAPRYEVTDALPNDQLIVYDHASMREGLELRTPFLSRRVAEAAARIDPRAFMAFGQKSVLRRLLGRYLPRELYDYPKSGFRFPHDVFLRGCGEATPRLPDDAAVDLEAAWRRRGQGQGWARIAVRAAAAARFMASHANPAA